MGVDFEKGNFKVIMNKIADALLVNITLTTPRYKKAIEKLMVRAEKEIRKGKKHKRKRSQESLTQEIVGELFSEFPIDDNEFILLNNTETFNIPENNIDNIRDELLTSLLYEDGYNKNTRHYTKNNLGKNIKDNPFQVYFDISESEKYKVPKQDQKIATRSTPKPQSKHNTNPVHQTDYTTSKPHNIPSKYHKPAEKTGHLQQLLEKKMAELKQTSSPNEINPLKKRLQETASKFRKQNPS